MTVQEEERITAAAREDLTLLLKEYARAGYKAVHGRLGEGFEEMWDQAFGINGDEEKPRD